MMEALGRHTDVLVPPVVGYESDESVLGAPFFVMEKIDGRIPEDNPPYHTEGWVTEYRSRRARDDVVERDRPDGAGPPRSTGSALGLDFLDDTQRGHAGIEQQLDYYGEYLEWAAEGRPQPVTGAAFEWMQRQPAPARRAHRLCWGDSRIGNMIFDDHHCVPRCWTGRWSRSAVGCRTSAWWLLPRPPPQRGRRVAASRASRRTTRPSPATSG